MSIIYKCDNCFEEFDTEYEFETCRGDACHQEYCRSCMKRCKDPDCKRWICEDCQVSKDCGSYCIDHAMWDDDAKNFDYIAQGLTHEQGLKYLNEHPKGL